ncbi:MAG: hypothetical protein RIB98_16550 [Acidimicrobiales bacterium]
MSIITSTPTTQTPTASQIDGRMLLDVSLLRSKAADLRVSAADISAPLSTTYRRRAAELELEAAALAARFGLVEDLTLAA